MARATLSELISLVRRLTNAQVADFTDDQVQGFLDARRLDVVRAPLRSRPNSRGEYLDYYSDFPFWEPDALLEGAGGTALTPSVSEWLAGHWRFASHTPPPVYITGKAYDVYGAAADLLEAWASKVALEFDFSSDGGSFQRSQKREALLDLAKAYRRQSWAVSVVMYRDDILG